jgi:hypothetical protein
MTFDQNPVIVVMFPVIAHPNSMLMGRTLPTAWNPFIVVVVVTLIARNPDVTVLWGWSTMLVYVMWWSFADDDFLRGGREGQCGEDKQQCKCDLFHLQ